MLCKICGTEMGNVNVQQRRCAACSKAYRMGYKNGYDIALRKSHPIHAKGTKKTFG